MRYVVFLCFAITAAVGLASACSSGTPPQRRVTVSPIGSAYLISAWPRRRQALDSGDIRGRQPPTRRNLQPARWTPSPRRSLIRRPPSCRTRRTAALPPTDGKWIDVDVTQLHRPADGRHLHDAGDLARRRRRAGRYRRLRIDPDRHVPRLQQGGGDLAYDPPYETYISHWVGFDPDRANGFHSFLKDKDGNVVDASTGRVSNGCIRTGDPDAVFAFAEIGMPVYVHS